MLRSGTADLPLHSGSVPAWLRTRMDRMAGAIAENVIEHYGRAALLSRISDPAWFQAFGAVMGMDWHSSGITTSVMGSLKRAFAGARGRSLGLYICGGRGRQSRQTPAELLRAGEQSGHDGDALARISRLTARVDNNAVADGFQIYLHSFVLTAEGDWAVVQQGLNDSSGLARRYHWHSPAVRSFTADPHAAIVGQSQGELMNLVDSRALPAQAAMLELAAAGPDRLLREARHITLPRHHDVRTPDVDLHRLGAVLAVSYDRQLHDFAELLLMEKMGPRTLQTLALVAEVIHGAPTRFADPARFSFSLGGKDGHPFPVPLRTYDESLAVLRRGLTAARLGNRDRNEGLRALDRFVEHLAKPNDATLEADFNKVIAHEKRISPSLDGRTVQHTPNRQMALF